MITQRFSQPIYGEKSLRDEPDINNGCEVTQQSQHYQCLRNVFVFFEISNVTEIANENIAHLYCRNRKDAHLIYSITLLPIENALLIRIENIIRYFRAPLSRSYPWCQGFFFFAFFCGNSERSLLRSRCLGSSRKAPSPNREGALRD